MTVRWSLDIAGARLYPEEVPYPMAWGGRSE